jgi:uncharacterized protein with von Willebrand factor type A (vWA) domain
MQFTKNDRGRDPVWFLNFFYLMRQKGIPVSLTEWMTLMQALHHGLHEHSLDGFYQLCRTILLKSETDFDTFDQLFAYYFRGKELPAIKDVTSELLEWLREAIEKRQLPEELLAELGGSPERAFEQLMEDFEKLLGEQTERHDGGSKWIGTGGTSPFGHSGASHQPGIRVGGEGGGRSAIAVAGERRYKGYRRDLILDVRQIKAALKKLRVLAREGSVDELDIDETIDATCKNAGDIELIFRKSRKNSAKVLLLMDSGGSMTPHAKVCSLLFSAAHQMSHFKDFQHYYFHNAIYHYLYRDNWQSHRTAVNEFLHKYDSGYKVIFVGDACMAPYELLHPWYGDGRSGLDTLVAMREHFSHLIWLNPEPKQYWNHETIDAVRKVVPMFPLTIDGIGDAIQKLLVMR